MMQVHSPFEQFFGTDGVPLSGGSVYIGTVGLNPETNPIAIYWDEDKTIPAAQPVKTLNGYAVRNGTPARVYIDQNDYSLTVKDKKGQLVFFVAKATSLADAAKVSYLPAGTGAVPTDVQSVLRQYMVSVFDFMTKAQIADVQAGTLTIDCAAAINAANTYLASRPTGGTLWFPNGVYLTLSGIDIPAYVNWLGESPGWVSGTNANYGVCIYKKHTSNAITFNKTIAGGQYVENICIVGRGAVDVGGSGFVINTASDVVLRRCNVFHVYLHSFVVGDGSATCYTCVLDDCYSNNPETGNNFVINSTLFRGHKMISDGGLRGLVLQPAATNWSIGECHFEGFTNIGITIGSGQGKTYGKTYLAGTNASGLIGVQAYGNSSGITLTGLQIAFNAVRAGSKGLEITGSATTITLRDSTIATAEIGVSDTTTGIPAATCLENNVISGCTVGIKAASQGSKYIGNTFIGSTYQDITHDDGSGGLWMGNRFSLVGNSAINPGVTGQAGNFSGNCVKNNYGYVTRNSGYASGVSSPVVIAHGLAAAPLANGSVINCSPYNAGYTSPIGVTNQTSANFTATWTGTSPNNFTWEARLVCDF